MVICPRCGGEGGAMAFINRGSDLSRHSHEWLRCNVCLGQKSISHERADEYERGRQLRADRIARGESLWDAAQKLRVSPSVVSRMERGEA